MSAYTFFIKSEISRRVVITRWILIVIKLLLIPVMVMIQLPLWWLLCLMLAVFSFVEYRAMKLAPSIIFSETEIVLKSVFRKKYLWFDIDHIILKDDLLTVDFRDNRILQKEVSSTVNEAAFNRWCLNKLNVSNN